MALMHAKQSIIVDLDPQASCSKWSDSREWETPVVISTQVARLSNVLETAIDQGVDFSFIDTSPHAEASALAAIRKADLVLVPCRPAILDLRAIDDTVELVKIAKKLDSTFVVLNSVPSVGSLGDEASEAIASYDLQVCPVKLGHRTAFSRSLNDGLTSQEVEPRGKAAKEVQALYMWMCENV